MSSIRQLLRASVEAARARAVASGSITVTTSADLPPVSIERPARPEHGDYATNVAMQLAPLARMAPMRIAEALLAALELPEGMGSAELAPPGFINIRLDAGWVAGQVAEIRSAGAAFGYVPSDHPRSVNVEFVSANPTGPLTLGNARGAFVGDLLCRVLEAVGHRVTREYYFNDFNAQVRNLGLSVLARRRDEPIPEDGYHGEYVADLAASLPDEVYVSATAEGADAAEVLGRWASERVRAGIEESLERLGVHFDVWTSEDPSTAMAGSSARSSSSAESDTSTNRTVRRGSGRRPLAMTRTALYIGPTDSPPISRQTSATSPRSSRADSTSWSTCGARTTMAPWRATARLRRHWGSMPMPSTGS